HILPDTVPVSTQPLPHPIFLLTDTATTEIYTLSLHDALPIYGSCAEINANPPMVMVYQIHTYADLRKQIHEDLRLQHPEWIQQIDRKSTRLNSSHVAISYAVFFLKKKNKVTELLEVLRGSAWQ